MPKWHDGEVELDDYLRIFAPYEVQLRDFRGSDSGYGGRFALLFRQVVRLLVRDAEINRQLPRLYVRLARAYLERRPDTVRHFAYEENRHFFLAELRDWLEIRHRGRRLRRMGKE